jgi:hypothetical protein
MGGQLIDVGDPKGACSGISDHDGAAGAAMASRERPEDMDASFCLEYPVLGFLVPIEERLERLGEGFCGEGMVLVFLATVGAASSSPSSALSPARGWLLRFKVLATDRMRSGCIDCGAEAGCWWTSATCWWGLICCKGPTACWRIGAGCL